METNVIAFVDTLDEYLFKELQSHYEEDQVYPHRARREATDAADAKECSKRNWKKDMQCCKGGNVIGDQLELFKSVKKQCIADLKGEPGEKFFNASKEGYKYKCSSVIAE